MKIKKKRIIILLCAAAAVTAWIAFCGYQWCWGPFSLLHDIKTNNHPGNAPVYGLENTERLPDSPLRGKTVVFLGSSVTCGSASGGVSFADYLAVRHDFHSIKEAVPGTTLVDTGASSYISRLDRLETDKADLFICQLSTNDATQNIPLGAVSESFEPAAFDTSTVAGAIEYILASARQRWDCPVVFYTNPRYDSEAYGDMVALLEEIAGKWDIYVIDFWNDAPFNDLSAEERSLYMADAIHPTQAGYSLWWMPEMEEVMLAAAEG